MALIPILILIVVFWGLTMTMLLKQRLVLKKKLLRLEKELEIQDSRLDYQKKHYSDSANYLFSTEIIIMEMLQEIDSALKSEEGDLSEKILHIIFDKAKALLKPEKCILFKIGANENIYSCLYSFGYKDEQLHNLNLSLDADNSFLGWSAATGRFLSFDDAQQDSLLSHFIESDPLKTHYSQPLKVNNKVKAVLCVGALSQHIEKDITVRFFSILSNIASVALSNALLTQELRELSVRDSLTGLYNHSYFQKWLENSLGKLSEKDNILSLAMADLDYFKSVNDTDGHQTGDIVLKNISGLLNNPKTHDYICARYGGDEFAFAFMGKDRSQTLSIMEDIRKRISEKVFEIHDKCIRITISIGIAEARFSEVKKINKRDLIDSADQALYKAKAQGRNRVVLS